MPVNRTVDLIERAEALVDEAEDIRRKLQDLNLHEPNDGTKAARKANQVQVLAENPQADNDEILFALADAMRQTSLAKLALEWAKKDR